MYWILIHFAVPVIPIPYSMTNAKPMSAIITKLKLLYRFTEEAITIHIPFKI